MKIFCEGISLINLYSIGDLPCSNISELVIIQDDWYTKEILEKSRRFMFLYLCENHVKRYRELPPIKRSSHHVICSIDVMEK